MKHCNVSSCGTASVNISDHELVYACVCYNKKSTVAVPITYRDIKNINLELLYTHVRSIPWKNIYPLKTFTFKKQNKLWFTDNIKLLMTLKGKALVKFKRTKNPVHWEEYKNIKNFATSSIRRERKAYLQHFINTFNESVWKSLNNLGINTKTKNMDIPQHLSSVNSINNYFLNSVPHTPPNNNILNYYSNVKESLKSNLTFEKRRLSQKLANCYFR